MTAISLEPRIFPELAVIDKYGLIYIYSSQYHSIFKFESKRLRKVPHIDLNRFSDIDYCINKLAINQDGDFGLLDCNNIVYLFSKNGAYKGSFSSEINKPIFLVPIREHWFVFNDKGDGESVFDKSVTLHIPAISTPIVDIKNMNRSLAILSKDHISASPIESVSAEIYEVRDFLSAEECQLLIDQIKSTLRPSTIATSGEYDHSYRTSSTCDLGNINNPYVDEINRRICNFIGIDPSYGETLQGQHYLEGQEFKEHTDYFEGSQLLEHDNGRGQRTYTFMIYLNDVNKGGTTEFHKLSKIFKPERGKALIWNNLNDDGTTNENTIHQAHPIIDGEKTIITKWFRQASNGLKSHEDLNKHIKTYTNKGF